MFCDTQLLRIVLFVILSWSWSWSCSVETVELNIKISDCFNQ